MTEALDLTITKTIPASPKKVFEAWLSEKALAEFIRPADSISTCRVKVDAVEGGNFEIIMMAGDTEMPHHGTYTKINRYSELAFSWLSAHSIPESLVTLTFKELEENLTELSLHHVGFASQDTCDAHLGGWTNIIDALTVSLG